ncbi:histidine phosphatase family protein [Rubeoparvulum massiliense]|uniref:histidine phosphatase family protein n=1 Tax=Rubeoparvulum massiliense TaxID=1631346 RepID=UPI00065E66C8|nr:histidine phosphatase family protein [Rubeoparvulum massiliense]
MRLTIVRHGESLGNVQRVLQGQQDYPLTERGKQQADKVARRLVKEPFDVILSSDLTRAYDTALAIAKYHRLPVIKMKELREFQWGILEGLTQGEVVEQYPDLVDEDWGNSGLHGVEGREAIRQRARLVINLLLDEYLHDRVCLVSHGGFINALIMELLNIEWDGAVPFAFHNTSVSQVQFYTEERFRILYLNDTSHLGPMDNM